MHLSPFLVYFSSLFFNSTKQINITTTNKHTKTYHGPGQLVVYPLLDLRNEPYEKDLHWYLRMVEEVIIQTLHVYGIHGVRDEINTGEYILFLGKMQGAFLVHCTIILVFISANEVVRQRTCHFTQCFFFNVLSFLVYGFWVVPK